MRNLSTLLALLLAATAAAAPAKPAPPKAPAGAMAAEPAPVEPAAPAVAPAAEPAPEPAKPAARAQKIKAAVLDINANGAPAELATNVTSLVAIELERLEVFSVISRQEIRAMLSHEAEKQALGCDAGSSCLAELGGALGVQYLVSGSLGKIGDSLLLNLALSDVGKATVEGRAAENIKEQGKLPETVARATQKLVQKILADRTATLIVTCSEKGAVVRIDGQAVGTTPLARRKISWGPHTLEVEKNGFITATEDFTVQTKGIVERQASLIPSGDFLQAYESGARRMRIGAWLTTAGAIAGFGAAAYYQTRISAEQDDFKSKLDNYDNTPAAWTELNNIKGRQESALTNARITGGIGLAFAVGAAFFWIAGEDPDRYARYRELAQAPSSDDDASPRFALEFFSPTGLVGARLDLP